MTQIIPDGGSRTSQDLYVGVAQEITIDTSNKEIRVHDGATPGGLRIPNLNSNNTLYQLKNTELDGIKFEPNQRGFLTRVGAGQYRIRSIVGVSGITVTNGNGYDDSPSITISASIPGDKTFENDVAILGKLGVVGGIVSDLIGNVQGNLTGNSTGTHTGPTIGNVDTRGATLLLDDGQIPQRAIAGLVAALSNLVEPIGVIKCWGLGVANIPSNWHVCDGTNGTPDLRGKFIVAADAATQDQIGGSTTHTHTATIASNGAHTHAITIADTALTLGQIPSHQHLNGVTDSINSSRLFVYGQAAVSPATESTIDSNSADGTFQGKTSFSGSGEGHSHAGSSDSSGAHVHAVTIDSGSSLPPFYSLVFIMKIA